MAETLHDAFPQLDRETCARVERAGQFVELASGSEIFNIGDGCENFILALSGTVRVQLVSDTGRRIILYRVAGGDSCILTTACLFAGARYTAEALAETDVNAVLISRDTFSELLESSPDFRKFVFALFAERLSNVIGVLEGVAFRGVDARLANFLLQRGATQPIDATHADIAADIGTAREVVSRHLKQFAERGLVLAEAAGIVVKDPHTLRIISNGR